MKEVDSSLKTLPNSEHPSIEGQKLLNQSQSNTQSSVYTYTLADDQSILSRDVDNWTGANVSFTETIGVQGSGVAVVQRSTIVTSSMEDANGLWYLLAMMLPLLSINRGTWRATPSTILYSAEILFLKLSRACGRVGHQIRRMAQNQMSRDVFATVMDIVLVVYAIGFLILSMYQASITGRV